MTREKFLKNFNLISHKLSEKIAVYYSSDLCSTIGISFLDLNRISEESSRHLSQILGTKFQYVAVSCTDYCHLPCLILSIWKSGFAFAGLGSQYTLKSNLNFLNFLKIKYIISDNNEKYGKIIDEFFILHKKYFILQRKDMGDIETKDICYGIMTSGSTGEAKIIQVPWYCIIENVKELAKKFNITESDCVFLASPYSFDPFFVELFFAFLKGCSLIIVSDIIKLCSVKLLKVLFSKNNASVTTSTEIEFQPSITSCKRPNITVLQMTPSVFKRWSDYDIKDVILAADTSLRILVLGGEKFPNEILKLKSSNNETRIFNIYGITEISCWAFLNEIKIFSSDTEISIGKPLKDITFSINENDELCINSQIRKCFVNIEKQNSESIYRNTGDLVCLKNNELYYMGRSNQIVKKYGIKINLAKIESSFLNYNRSIKECYCIFDDVKIKTALFYVPRKCGENYKVHSMQEFIQKGFNISQEDFKDVEQPDFFIEISNPPINLHGKCDKEKLKQFLKSLKTSNHLDVAETFFRIWVEVLGVGSQKYSFKGMGGNSIQALNIISKLEFSGFRVPQNFLTQLLSNGSYETCLNILTQAKENFMIPKKRKTHQVTDEVDITVKWKFDLGKCVDATPTIFTSQGKERVVVGSHSSKLSCLDADSGSEIWTISLGDRIESGFTVSKDGAKGFVGCYDYFVYCVDVSNGNLVWKYKTDDMVKSTPCLSSDGLTLYAASYDKHLHCLSAENGQFLTKIKLSDGGIFSSGKISDRLKIFYIGTLDGTCVALNQTTNEIQWKIKLETPIFSSSCLINHDSRIVFAEVLGIVHCFDAIDGTRVWSYQADGNIYSSPLEFDSDHLIFGCHDSHVYCLHGGSVLKWKQEVHSPVFAKPSRLNDWICVTSTKGFIYICDFVSGCIKSRIELGGEIFSSPVTTSEKVFVGCRDNYVYSLHVSKIND